MDGTRDTAGVGFAVLIILAAIPLTVTYFRRRRELDQESKMTIRILLTAAVLNGAVNVVKSLGLMPDDATYWTLDYSLAALFFVTLLRFSWVHRRKS